MDMRKIAFSLIGVALLSSCSLQKRYSPESYAWALPEIKAFERLNVQPIPKNGLLFIGSSSIRLWKTLAQDMAPYPVVQRGYGGAHLRDAIFFSQALLGNGQPAMIIGFIANDIKGVPEDERPQRVKRLFKYFVKQVRKRYPKTPFLWVEITPTQSRWAQWKAIQKVNQKIKDYCEKKANLYFVETATAFLTAEGLPRTELFVEDQLHLNQQGYALWSRLIKQEIEWLLNQPSLSMPRTTQ